jgi:hypothetical protein
VGSPGDHPNLVLLVAFTVIGIFATIVLVLLNR